MKEEAMTKLPAVAASAAVVATFTMALCAPAFAHNAGHIIRPDGSCVNVGSFNSGPFVPEQNPNQNTTPGTDYGRLDLEAGRGDQYGARFAADQGSSQVERRFCEEIGLASATDTPRGP